MTAAVKATLAGAITVRMKGGLGNQLFEYAAGRAMALKVGCPLQLDVSKMGRSVERPFLLDRFAHAGICVKGGEIPRYNKTIIWRLFGIKTGVMKNENFIFEANNEFDPRLISPRSGKYYSGYWQCSKYFDHIESTLREDLQFVDAASGENLKILERIEKCEAISVHLRRGDYLAKPHELQRFVNCRLDYYRSATSKVLDFCKTQPDFFIFSDDLNWARANLELPGQMHFVDINSNANAHEDLRLMAACKHNIIANSTFSWWGAWLNPRSDKVTIAPKRWYLDPTMSNDFINSPSFITISN